jgi:RHS repeat-associated protein
MQIPLQDITYTYDPVGNVTYVENTLSGAVYNGGQKVSPDFDYTYDALYRLKESQGREHPGIGEQGQKYQNNFGAFWDKTPVSDASKITSYTESYGYDLGNNLESIQHQGKKSWKRTTTIAENTNRLASSVIGSNQPTNYNYDAAGNQTDLGGKAAYWNYRNNIASVGIIERATGDPDAEYYVYDSGGSRVRKVNESQANGGANTIVGGVVYLGDFEIRQKGSGATKSEWHQVRFSDGKNIFCELRYQTQGTVKPEQNNHQTRYQLTNLINSIGMEVDGEGALISYEEYYPYGGTSFIAGKKQTEVKSRHYRYSGKEQDRSGLYYYGMRYYCSWTGRWMSADPAGTVDGLNLYAFVGGNPVTHVDVGGLGLLDAIKAKFSPKKEEPSNEAIQPSTSGKEGFMEKVKAKLSGLINSKTKKLKSGITTRLYPNRNHEHYKKEQETSSKALEPSTIKDVIHKEGTNEFKEILTSKREFMWVLDSDESLTISDRTGELNHPSLAGGKDVIAAGTGRVKKETESRDNKNAELNIDFLSGHYHGAEAKYREEENTVKASKSAWGKVAELAGMSLSVTTDVIDSSNINKPAEEHQSTPAQRLTHQMAA